jgi:hypothetical protein
MHAFVHLNLEKCIVVWPCHFLHKSSTIFASHNRHHSPVNGIRKRNITYSSPATNSFYRTERCTLKVYIVTFFAEQVSKLKGILCLFFCQHFLLHSKSKKYWLSTNNLCLQEFCEYLFPSSELWARIQQTTADLAHTPYVLYVYVERTRKILPCRPWNSNFGFTEFASFPPSSFFCLFSQLALEYNSSCVRVARHKHTW